MGDRSVRARLMQRALILAVDGLDWPLLQSLVDDGQLPFIDRLISGGASGALRQPTGRAASAWASAATGMLPDRHGVCHDLAVRQDGLTCSAATLQDLRSPTLWQLVSNAGRSCWTIGWPATLPGDRPDLPMGSSELGSLPLHSRAVQGFEFASGPSPDGWPMSPGVCWPASLYDRLRETRLHPTDFLPQEISPLVPANATATLVDEARRVLARWASIQSLGVSWAAESDWHLLAIRFDGLPDWVKTLRTHGPELTPEAQLGAWYAWLDMAIGRYMGLLGPAVSFVLISDRGLPFGAGESDFLEAAHRPGGMVLTGPGLVADSLLAQPEIVDLTPTILAMLGLPIPDQLDGHNLVAAQHGATSARTLLTDPIAHRPQGFAPEKQNAAALAWLTEQGEQPLDLQPLQAIAAAIEMESLLTWAQCRLIRGRPQEAIDTLERALSQGSALAPNTHASARLLLGQALLAAGQIDACRALLNATPAGALPAVGYDLYAALIAYTAQDWPLAEHLFTSVLKEGALDVNAAAWLGWCRLEQGDFSGAVHWFDQALNCPVANGRLHEGRARALFILGRLAEAGPSLDTAIAYRPYDAVLHLLRAQICEQAGDQDQARSALWRAFELDPRLTAGSTNLLRGFSEARVS